MEKTPLHETHKKARGKMVAFHGWEMPLQYEGIIAEHLNTRNAVSLFDVSHMGKIYIEGKDALKNLQHLTCNDVSILDIGQVQYTAMLYTNGAPVDDLTVYRLGEQKFQLCVNASNIEKDFDWIQTNTQGQVEIKNQSNQIGQIAVQGKFAETSLQQLTKYPLQDIKYYWFAETYLDDFKVKIARMGYTGEDGFEIFCETSAAVDIWNRLMECGKKHQIKQAGLGSRDTLRLEICYPLYGNDLDKDHTVLESGLGWIVKWDKGVFIGKDALIQQKEEGLKQRLISLKLDTRGVPREGYKIFEASGKQQIGIVTSGTSSPVLKEGIAMGYVQWDSKKVDTKLQIEIRNKMVPAHIVKAPFIKIKK